MCQGLFVNFLLFTMETYCLRYHGDPEEVPGLESLRVFQEEARMMLQRPSTRGGRRNRS